MRTRKGKAGNYSYLPGSDEAAAEVARRKAVKGILAMANMRLPGHLADADEPLDPVESYGFSAAAQEVAVEEPDDSEESGCTCDACKSLNGERERKFLSFSYMVFTEARVFQSRPDARYELYALAPTSRGARASAELRRSGRIRF